MIKIERKSEGASIFKGDTCWDTLVDGETTIKILGITVYHRKQYKKWDFAENCKRTGFKNGNE